MTDLLSRWTGSHKYLIKWHVHVQDPILVPVDIKLLEIDPELQYIKYFGTTWLCPLINANCLALCLDAP